MPIDPNIIAGLKPVQIQTPDPLEQYGKTLTLRNLMQQGDLGTLQYEHAQRAGESEKRLNALFANNANPTPEEVTAADPNFGIKYRRAALDAQKTQSEIAKNQQEVEVKALASHRDELANVKTPEDAAAWVMSGFKDPILGPLAQRSGKTPDQVLATIPKDPQELQTWIQRNALGATKYIEANKPKVTSQNLGGTEQLVSTPGLGGAPSVLSSTPKTMTPAESANLGLSRARYAFDTGQQPPGTTAAAVPSGGAGPAATPAAQPASPGLSPKAAQEVALAFQKKRAENAGEYDKALNERVAQGADLNMRLQETNQALQDFKTGGGRETRVKLAQMAQAVPGISPDLVNRIAGGDIAAAQEFEKLQISSAMEQLRLAMGGTGRITQSEFAAFRQANPNLNLDPNAIKKISDFTTKIYRLSRDEQQSFNKWISEGKNPADFRAHWDQQLEAKGVTQPNLSATPLGAKPNEKPTVIKGDDGFNALPSGALFVGPDGKTRRKP